MGGAEGNSSIPISHFPQAGSKWYEWEEVGGGGASVRTEAPPSPNCQHGEIDNRLKVGQANVIKYKIKKFYTNIIGFAAFSLQNDMNLVILIA